MRPAVAPLLLLAVAGCSSDDGAQLRSERAACRPTSPGAGGRVLLQSAPPDVSGPFYSARTDGPCGLFVAFGGAPQGDGPCNVAEYVGRLEPAGEDLRLVVEERHTGPSPTAGTCACRGVGAERSLRMALDAPLAGRRVVDAQGHALQLVDGAGLLRLGDLPSGGTAGAEGTDPAPPAYWSLDLRGPGVQVAESLHPGG